MLLAAGLGQRLRPLTDTLPKPLFDAGGKSLIEHQLVKLEAAGFREVVINLHHLGHLIEERLGDGSQLGLSIEYSWETQLLETGGGIKAALELLGDDPFAVVSADVFIDLDFNVLHRDLSEGCLGHLVMVSNPEHHPEGDFSLQAGVLGHETPRLTYSGVSVLSPNLVRHVPDDAFKLRQVFNPAIDSGQMRGVKHEGYWCDVGTLDRFESLKKHLSSQQVAE